MSRLLMQEDNDVFHACSCIDWETGKEVLDRLNKGKWFWERWSTSSFVLAIARLVEHKLVEVHIDNDRARIGTMEEWPFIPFTHVRRRDGWQTNTHRWGYFS